MKEKICGIYKITNLVNGKLYIGQSVDIMTRWRAYRSMKSISRGTSLISNAIQKYGRDNFKFEIIERVEEEKLNERESFWIFHYGSSKKSVGYNLTTGGTSRNHITEEFREKLSKAQSVRFSKPEQIEKSKSRGKASMDKMRLNEPEKWEARKQKISKTMKTIRKSWKSVRCIETGEIFESIQLAGEKYGGGSHIAQVCKGKRRVAAGLHWEYAVNITTSK